MESKMIKWESNFQIEDVSMQLFETYVRVAQFTNMSTSCVVKFNLTDESGDNVVKSYSKTYDRTFANEIEIYEHALPEFTPAVIV